MKVLKLSSYCYPERFASSHLSSDMNEAYQENQIVCEIYAPTPTRGIDEETYNKYKKIKYEEMNGGYVRIHRFSMFREPKNSLLRAFRYTLCIIIQFFKALTAKNINVYYASSTPPINGLMFPFLKLFKRFKIVYGLQDIFPDSLVSTGMTKKGSLIWRIGRLVESITYKYCDKIVVLSEGFKKNIMEKGVPEEKIEVIYNWIDTDKVKPVLKDENPLFEEIGASREKFTVVYAGNLGSSQGANVIIDAALELCNNKDIQFVIFGGGSEYETVEKRIGELGLDNVIMNPLLPQEKVKQVYSMGDVALITCKAGVGKTGMPSKTWTIMACNTPIIAAFDKGSELEEIINLSGGGICVEPENARELSDAILSFYNSPEDLKVNSREFVEKNMSKKICVSKYIEILKQYESNAEGEKI